MSGLLKFSSAAVVSVASLLGPLALPSSAQTPVGRIGSFEGGSDIGEVVRPGTAEYDTEKNTYTITAAGENMWSTRNAFYFLWKKVWGDVELSADIGFPQEGGRPHREAELILKQDLSDDGVYADAALHGSGMTVLQYRRTIKERRHRT
jgi:hypothetical protein